MKFNKLVYKLLEDFNIYPNAQAAVNSGPDQGMTKGDINNTFPSANQTVVFKLPSKKKRKHKLKKKTNRPTEIRSTR